MTEVLNKTQMVEIRSICAGYSMREGFLPRKRRPIVDNLTFSVEPGSILGLVGANGSGKSTIIRAVVDPDARTGGSVVSGRVALKPGDIAYVPQGPATTLSSWLTVAEEIALPYRVRGITPDTWRPAVASLVERYQIPISLTQRISELSGGQRVWVAVLRALAVPQIRLAVFDEPFEHLDSTTRKRLLETIRSLSDSGVPVIVTSHRIEDLQILGARNFLVRGSPVTHLQGVLTVPPSSIAKPPENTDSLTLLPTQPIVVSALPSSWRSSIWALLGFVAGLTLWALAAQLVNNARLLPPPTGVFREMIKYVTTSDGVGNFTATMARVFGWWFVANLVAMPLGILLGYDSRLFRSFSVWLWLGRCMPVFALIGVARGIFPGIEWVQIGFLICLTMFLISLQSISLAAAVAPRRRFEIAKIFGASHLFRLTRIMPYETFPAILSALEVTLPLGVIVTVVVESYTFPTHGFGLDVYNNLDSADMSRLFAAILLPGAVAAVALWLLRYLAARFRSE